MRDLQHSDNKMDITENALTLIEINKIMQIKEHVLIAIDGRCASGKTTLAENLRKELSCNLFHMDDFFLRPEQRTPERYSEPGGNVDRERFSEEVLEPLLTGMPFSYRPFDCRSMSLGDPVRVIPSAVEIVEGTYSCHPDLRESFDLRIFITTAPEKQLARLTVRNSADLETFRRKWIPLEECYFSAFSVEKHCELVLYS